MKIEKINIKNWRSIKELEIGWQNLLVFIWANNAGKSNILSSILFFFDEIKCDQMDICKTSSEEVATVEIIFNNLSESDLAKYSELICNDKIIIKKTFNRTDDDVFFEKYGNIVDTTTYPWLDYNYENYNSRSALSVLPLSWIVSTLYPLGTITKPKFKEIVDQYKVETPSVSMPWYEFIGKKNPLDVNILYVPALKDVNDEFSRWVISKLLKECFDDVFQHPTMSAITWTIRTEIDKLNTWSVSRPASLLELEREISSWMIDWNAKFKVKFDTNVEDILKSSCKIFIDDWIESDITRKWHWFQRNLIFSLLKIRQNHHWQNQQNSILLFEEPELYLHPQAQRRIYDEIKLLSDNLLFTWLTTHSNLFIKLEDYQSICIVRKNWNETSKSQEISDLFWTDKEKFQLLERIDASRSELFFSKKAIFVEGITEKVVIPYFALKLGCSNIDYSIVMCDGKDSIPLYLKLCQKFDIDYIVLFDKDNNSWRLPAALVSCDASSQRIMDATDYYITLNNDIEEEINYPWYVDSSTKPKRYQVFEYVTNSSYAIPHRLAIKIKSLYQ
jgi:putative ATP-dependent endonuclease of OLD family